MKRRNAATRADLAKFGRGLRRRMDRGFACLGAKIDGTGKRLDDKIDGTGKRLDDKIDGVEKRLGTRIDGLDTKVDRVALELLKRMDGLQESHRASSRQLDLRVTEKLETFTSRMETLWQESATLPNVADKHGRQLRDHESRISALESRPSPP